MTRTSIRRRLLLGVAAIQIVAALLVAAIVVRHERNRSYALLDAQIAERAALVQSAIESPDTPTDKAILHRELLSLPHEDVYTLSEATGALIAASGPWRMPLPLPARLRSIQRVRIDGHRYRVLVLRDVSMVDDGPTRNQQLPRLTLIYGARTRETEEHIDHVAWVAAWTTLAILLASLAAAAWVVHTGLRPLVEMADQAARIDATHWNWTPPAAAGEAAELAPLSFALTRLVARLRAAFTRERQFSADAAHEMKTGIAIVKSTLQLALERPTTPAQDHSALHRALEDTERMQALVSAMLQLARIEGLDASAALPASEPADAIAVLHKVASRLEPVLAVRAIALKLPSAHPPIPLELSADDLAVALTNLIENAIHYSPDGSTISVSADIAGPTCTLAVADQGCGIRPEDLPHVFERFYRADPSRSRNSGGNGLGLAIVDAVVRSAGGSISAASTPPDGSTFTLHLPLA